MNRRPRPSSVVIAGSAETTTPADPTRAKARGRRWRGVLTVAIAFSGTGVLIAAGRPTLTDSVSALRHLDWAWVPLAVAAEAASMAAFAGTQRRLLRAGGTNLPLGSVTAVTYAGNAISVSLPVAGPEAATGFVYRRYSRLGIDPAVAGWALAVSGVFSSLAFAFVLAGGAAASGNAPATTLGLVFAAISIFLTITMLTALRRSSVRHSLNRHLAHFIALSRKLVNRPGPEAADALDRLLDRVASLSLPRAQYAKVMALALWNWVADCLCLAFAIRAIGAQIPWQGLFLAYSAGMAAASIGLTPGGLGVVEATLSAALVATGIKGHSALAAVLVYRLISFWLVMTIGWAVVAILTKARPFRRSGVLPTHRRIRHCARVPRANTPATPSSRQSRRCVA
jgi:putative heme transporter